MTTDNENKTPADFLEEEQEGISYIKPNLELKLTTKKKQECRDIVKEIKSFGVNQRQIIFIIDLLALELENMEHVRAIRDAVKYSRENLEESSIILNSDS